jgi:Methyltransferase FkbM domain
LLTGATRLTKSTSAEELGRFLRAVWPVTTEHPLIRLGAGADGGYLVPDDLQGVKTCFSPGVSTTADFEMALAERGIRSLMADYSVEQAPLQHPLFHFEKKFVGLQNDDVFTTLQSWVDRHAPDDQDMILQMDIEGAEYSVLLSASEALLKRFRILVIEFHGLNDLAEKRGFELINLTFHRLLQEFDLVHAHVNNWTSPRRYQGYELPPLMEFSFLRKDRSCQRTLTTQFPHPLDGTNVSSRQAQVLPRCWYAAS